MDGLGIHSLPGLPRLVVYDYSAVSTELKSAYAKCLRDCSGLTWKRVCAVIGLTDYMAKKPSPQEVHLPTCPLS